MNPKFLAPENVTQAWYLIRLQSLTSSHPKEGARLLSLRHTQEAQGKMPSCSLVGQEGSDISPDWVAYLLHGSSVFSSFQGDTRWAGNCIKVKRLAQGSRKPSFPMAPVITFYFPSCPGAPRVEFAKQVMGAGRRVDSKSLFWAMLPSLELKVFLHFREGPDMLPIYSTCIP